MLEEQPLGGDVVVVRTVVVGVLAGDDRGHEPAVERQAADSIQPKRMAGDLENDGVRARTLQLTEGAVQFDRSGRREAGTRVEEPVVAHPERSDHAGSRASGIEERAQDFAGAGLAERAGEPNRRQRFSRPAIEAGGQDSERRARRAHTDRRHRGRHGARALGDNRGCASGDGVRDVGVSVEGGAGHGDERHAGANLAAVFTQAGDLGVSAGRSDRVVAGRELGQSHALA
jgi:hypothetical protein